MDENRKKMIETAGNPTGFWGKKMLDHMHTRHMELIQWGLNETDINQYNNVLDIGCGSGNALGYMYNINPNAHYAGLDYSKDSVVRAQSNNRRAVFRGQMKIITGNVCAMPYPDDAFDLIVSVESFYYWKDYDAALAEIKRVLKKDGKVLIILEAHHNTPHPEEYDEMTEVLDMFIGTRKELETMFEKAGFTVNVKEKEDWITLTAVCE